MMIFYWLNPLLLGIFSHRDVPKRSYSNANPPKAPWSDCQRLSRTNLRTP